MEILLVRTRERTPPSIVPACRIGTVSVLTGYKRGIEAPTKLLKEHQMYKTLAASAVALMVATSAFAQSAVTFEDNQTTIFVDEAGAMRPEADVRTRFMALPADQQVAIRSRCEEWSKIAPAGSSDLTDAQQYQANPVPGVIDMNRSCDYVSRFTP
jgi:hypothetical protein